MADLRVGMEEGGNENKFYHEERVIVNKRTDSFHATTHILGMLAHTDALSLENADV